MTQIKVKRKISINKLGDSFDIKKPFPNEHACRLIDPGEFGEFRRQNSDSADSPDKIFGIKDENGKKTAKLQAYRYPVDKFTETEAKNHCESHDGILFEPATGDNKNKSEHFVQRLEFDKLKTDIDMIRVWLSEHGYKPDIQLTETNTKVVAIFDDESVFENLLELDYEINSGIKAFIGPRKKFAKSNILKTDRMRRIIYAVAMEPNVIDTDREFFTPEAIEKAAHIFLRDYRKFNLEHFVPTPDVDLVESFIAPFEMKYSETDIAKAGSWIIGALVKDDELWGGVLSGDITGVSIEGFAKPSPKFLPEIDENEN